MEGYTVETTRGQPQFRRLLSLGISVTLICGLLFSQTGTAADMVAPASNYRPISGEEFFLLSETSYGTQEQASVRLEVQRNSSQLEEYGGVDVVLYRVPDPIAFLKAQTNLHRVKVPTKLQAEGMSNMLKVAWDKMWANTRYAWKTLFSSETRLATTNAAPELKTPADIASPTRLSHPAPYGVLPGMEVVDRFRYPVHRAKPIEAPKGVKLAGSSNEFLPQNEGNVRVPLGRRSPGLYLVEAYVGKHRALALVFVSDSVAVTKNTSDEMLTWVANRTSGASVNAADVVWSDGVGVLKSGKTAADGIARLNARSPETSYVYGVDPEGGAFISENFYHDSEIYNAKIYAVTDRPLYRPGDMVQVKFLGREFKSARSSAPIASGNLDLTVVDPAGTEILGQKVMFDGAKGGDTTFRLPASAQAGGWELLFTKGDDRYGAAFRVANYVKPHFEVDIVASKTEFKTNEAVTGRVRLSYPDGAPVSNAVVRLMVRAQALTMVQGELRYGGQFPVAIKADELRTDREGNASFSLPAAAEPSRYILSLLAQDSAAYRVRANKEILIERGATLWELAAPANFSRPGEVLGFRFSPQASAAVVTRPARWEILRLEDRQVRQGDVAAEGDTVKLSFPEAGSYTVSLRDAKGNLLAAATHWVAGEGMKAAPGSVEIVFDKESYQTGDTASALITFPQPVSEALLTLERDNVEATALLSGKANWLTLTKVAPAQWRAEIPVKENYGPNITFSALYVQDGDYVFQNKGLRVAVPGIEVTVRPEKERYAPGETVVLQVQTTQKGKPISANVTLGVVDEMIYVLQPEIAPNISQFFYHPRRNNVRTVASLSFIGYDLARMPGKGSAPVNRAPSERGVKILERPRRDDTDTAAWWPSLTTNAEGKTTVTFRMPDALTRWRMTARAISNAGVVGQSTRYVESHKNFYAKWSGPSTFRSKDQPATTVIAFNQTGAPSKVQLSVKGAGVAFSRDVTLNPGANTVALALEKPVTGDVEIAIRKDGVVVDSVQQPITVLPPGWLSERVQTVDLRALETRLTLPADARDVKVSLAQGAAGQFARVADDLLEYPWGCVEQTASRLLPLSFIYRSLPADAPRLRELSQTIATHRLRLIQMAGPEAVFGWWGNGTSESAWLTAYAYYADWHASRALGLKLPAKHWEQAMVAYTKHSANEPLALRTLAVWFMQEMDLPVRTLSEGLVQDAAASAMSGPVRANSRNSVWLGEDGASDALTLTLIAQIARQQKVALPAELSKRTDAARESLRVGADSTATALLAMEGKPSKEDAAGALALLGPTAPTLDRALALAWWNKALGGSSADVSKMAAPLGNWRQTGGALGAPTWRWTSATPPAAIQLSEPPSAALTGLVRYRSVEAEQPKLAVTLERKLYRLVLTNTTAAGGTADANPSTPASTLAGNSAEFTLEPAKDGDIQANELYLEEVRLNSGGKDMRLSLLEVPLPAGADVERGTWGIRIKNLNGDAEVLPIERARSQSGELSYAVPIDSMKGAVVVRHLLRFGSRGSFTLPPARFYRMYQPDEKAFEAGGERRLKVK